MADPSTLELVDCDQDVRPMLDTLLPKIEDLLKQHVDPNYSGERVIQLLRLERADAAVRGIQNISPTVDPTSGTIGWTVYGATTQMRDAAFEGRAMDYNPRITKSYLDKFVSVLGQRPFHNTTSEPGNPNSEQDRRGSRQVNLLLQMLHAQIPVKQINFELFHCLYKNGTAIGYVRTVTDGEKYGYYEVPNLVPQQQCVQCGSTFGPNGQGDLLQGCPNCGAPALALQIVPNPQQPTKRYPRSSVCLELGSGYTYTWPFDVVSFEAGSPWVICSRERDKGQMMAEWPSARKIVGSTAAAGYTGTSADATAAIARAASQSQTGTIRARRNDLWTEKVIWLDATELQKIEDDQMRALALQLYPKGLRLTQAEDKTLSIRRDCYKTRLSTCKPGVSEYLFTDGACWGMLSLEDAYSNLLNIVMETLETGIARFVVNSEYISADDMNRNRYTPNVCVEALPKFGGTLADAVQQLPTSDYPQQIPQTFEILDSIIQNFLGLLPQVYGEMPGNLTLGQARMMLNQGLMQLGTVAQLATNFWEQSDTNLVNLYCATVPVNPEYQGDTIDLDLIRNSKWTIRGDTSIPRSFAERVESLREILMNPAGPQLAQALKITDAANISKVRDYMDLPDMEDPDVEALEALKEIIDQLWQAQPTPPPPGPADPMTGIPGPPQGPPQPSIPFDPLIFDPMIAAQLCRGSLLKAMYQPTGPKAYGSPGFDNVKAFLQAAQQAAAPPPPPPPPPKLTISAKLPDMTPEQEGVTLQEFGIPIAQPSGAAAPPGGPQSHSQPQQQQDVHGGPPNSPQPPAGGGPPLLQQPTPIQPPGPSALFPTGGMVQ